MIVDIFNEVLSVVKTHVSPIKVLSHYPETTPEFPCVIMEEGSNTANFGTTDTSGEKFNNQTFEINIFTIGSEKVSTAKGIRNKVDSIMSDQYGMNRDYSGTIPSFLDNNIYRWVLRYSCVVDKDKKLYRR